MDWSTLDRLPALGVAQITTDGSLTRCNQAFGHILGDDTRHLIGKHVISDLTSIEDRPRAREDFDALISSEVDSIVHPKVIRRPDGTVISASFIAVMIQPLNADDESHILAFMFRQPEQENVADLHNHIRRLEEILALVLKESRNANGVTFQVTGADHSHHTSADHESEVSIGSHNSEVNDIRIPQTSTSPMTGVVWGLVIGLAIAMLVATLSSGWIEWLQQQVS